MPATSTILAELAADLRKFSAAGVHLDLATRLLYSTDASSYQITPLAVVIPKYDDDVLATVAACIRLGLPMLPRGSGTSLAGQAVGEAVVIDFSRHLDQVLHVDAARRRVLVQPGLTLDGLHRALAPYGLMVGPDPASSDRATLGGAIANNSTGAHSTVYGMMSDHVINLRTILADGREARLGPTAWAGAASPVGPVAWGAGAEAGLYRRIPDLIHAHADLIDARFPHYWRRSGGYNLDRLVAAADRGILDPVCLLAGSEGTLAVATELELGLDLFLRRLVLHARPGLRCGQGRHRQDGTRHGARLQTAWRHRRPGLAGARQNRTHPASLRRRTG